VEDALIIIGSDPDDPKGKKRKNRGSIGAKDQVKGRAEKKGVILLHLPLEKSCKG